MQKPPEGGLRGFTRGMRISEISRIEVADVFQPSGLIREEVSLRAAITKGCRQRCVYLSHPKVLAALDRYVERRWVRGKATAMDRRKWRGLMSYTSLVLTHKRSRYELSTKRRTNDVGEQAEYLAADSSQSYVIVLYRTTGLGKRVTAVIRDGAPLPVVFWRRNIRF
ncbi:integrase [Pandoraea horticolens]|uniref:Integrase n=1 Tax=Pandoraea horticolens TaxID=2508298 RepID=A0A5E4ZB77_9BURK|nr:site-specific integrase [Pandoraea horticolens]VVE58499.1 integrase [Pandoraea horticolens]